MLLDGDKDSLEAYLNGDRNSQRVRSYYTRRSIPLQTDHAASADYADTGGGVGNRDLLRSPTSSAWRPASRLTNA
jgi:hypothetical protein